MRVSGSENEGIFAYSVENANKGPPICLKSVVTVKLRLRNHRCSWPQALPMSLELGLRFKEEAAVARLRSQWFAVSEPPPVRGPPRSFCPFPWAGPEQTPCPVPCRCPLTHMRPPVEAAAEVLAPHTTSSPFEAGTMSRFRSCLSPHGLVPMQGGCGDRISHKETALRAESTSVRITSV